MDNNDIITWSIAIAAVAFVVLCAFLISLLRTAQRSLITAQSAMQEVKETVEGLQGEVKKLAETVNFVANDITGKLRRTDPLFEAVQDVGQILSEVTGTARVATKNISQAVRQKAAAIDTGAKGTPSWVKWAALGSRVAMGFRYGWKQAEQPNRPVWQQQEQPRSYQSGDV